jgi:hypothetical protein
MDLTPKSIFGGLMSLLIPTKLSQLENDASFQTPSTINSAVVPRYAKQHATTAGSPSVLTVVWPADRFKSAPIMPDPTVVNSDANTLYKATVTACDANGCTIKITKQSVNLTISLGALTLNPPVTAPVLVNVFAIQQTD